MNSDERRFYNRMNNRGRKHGRNWRQVWVNCGGMCVNCFDTENLEFHEPFGEERFRLGWLIFQSRILLCTKCHDDEHADDLNLHHHRHTEQSRLTLDVDIEIMKHGGYKQWIKDFELQDTFGTFLRGVGE